MILCKNRGKKSLHWPIGGDAWLTIAPGETFALHESDIEPPGLATAFRVLKEQGRIEVVETGLFPLLH